MHPLQCLSNSRSQNGFSLIELMVTVAIVGILAAIAIPTMQYFTVRAHQNEAQIDLAAIYTAEQSFSAAQGFYTCCLYQAGYLPASSTIYYTTGFWANCGNWFYDSQGDYCSGALIPWNNSVRNDATFEENTFLNADMWAYGFAGVYGTFTPTTFTAVAFGSVSSNLIFDGWTIDQNKTLINIQPGF